MHHPHPDPWLSRPGWQLHRQFLAVAMASLAVLAGANPAAMQAAEESLEDSQMLPQQFPFQPNRAGNTKEMVACLWQRRQSCTHQPVASAWHKGSAGAVAREPPASVRPCSRKGPGGIGASNRMAQLRKCTQSRAAATNPQAIAAELRSLSNLFNAGRLTTG